MITIIITSFKEPQSVGKAIEAVLANKIKEKYELLVAAPDKETGAVIQSYSRKHKQVKYFKDKGRGKANALNELFQRAKGDILILTDGDVFMSTNAISALLHALRTNMLAALLDDLSRRTQKRLCLVISAICLLTLVRTRFAKNFMIKENF